jgi:hypothetical protein
MAAAALCREAGFVLFAAYALRLLVQRRYGRASVFATALLPAVVWIWWVRTHVPGADAMGPQSLIPFRGLIDAVLHPRVYTVGAVWIRGLEVVQLAGLLLGVGIALSGLRKTKATSVRATACFLWALLAILLPPGVYDDPYAGARILSPMLLYQFLDGKRLPLAMATPRVWLQFGPQVIGILRGVL